jgi:hypothetical protein
MSSFAASPENRKVRSIDIIGACALPGVYKDGLAAACGCDQVPKDGPSYPQSLYCQLFTQPGYSKHMRFLMGQVLLRETPPETVRKTIREVCQTLLDQTKQNEDLCNNLKKLLDSSFVHVLSKLWIGTTADTLTYDNVLGKLLNQLETLRDHDEMTYEEVLDIVTRCIDILRILTDVLNQLNSIKDPQFDCNQRPNRTWDGKTCRKITKRSTKKWSTGAFTHWASKRLKTMAGRSKDAVLQVVTAPFMAPIIAGLKLQLPAVIDTMKTTLKDAYGLRLRSLGYRTVGNKKYALSVPTCREAYYQQNCSNDEFSKQIRKCTPTSRDLFCYMHRRGGEGLRRLLQELVLTDKIPTALNDMIHHVFLQKKEANRENLLSTTITLLQGITGTGKKTGWKNWIESKLLNAVGKHIGIVTLCNELLSTLNRLDFKKPLSFHDLFTLFSIVVQLMTPIIKEITWIRSYPGGGRFIDSFLRPYTDLIKTHVTDPYGVSFVFIHQIAGIAQ